MAKKKSKSNEIGDQIRAARIRKGLSQTAVGKMLGITRQGYGHYELGNALPVAAEIAKLCEILELDSAIFGISHPAPDSAVAVEPPIDADGRELWQLWPQIEDNDRRLLLELARRYAQPERTKNLPFENADRTPINRKR